MCRVSICAWARAHLDTEAYLRASGVTYTILRDEDQTLLLTGPKAYTLEQATATIASILGREIRFVVASQDDFIQRHAAKGEVAKIWATTYPALETGEAAVVDPLLEKVLGRPPVSFESRLRELLSAEGESREEVANWIGNAQGKAR